MRFPRFLFAALTLIVCVLLDFLVGPINAPASIPTSNVVSSSSLSPSTAMAAQAEKSTSKSSPAVSQEAVPTVTPPSFRAPDKAAELTPPPAALPSPIQPEASPNTSGASGLVKSAYAELPEPQATSSGLTLMTFTAAANFCSKQEKRLPTIMEVAKWAAHNGALVASVEDAKKWKRDSEANAIYLERGAKTKTVDFYFDRDRFAYPANRPVSNASIWTSDDRMLGGPAKANRYAFSLFTASFWPVPETSALSVVCLDRRKLSL